MVGRLANSCVKLSVREALLALAATSLAACASPRPPLAPLASSTAAPRLASHVVQPGETIYRIARAYGLSPSVLMAANGLSDPRQLQVGQSLFIPLNHQSMTGTGYSAWRVPRAERQFAWPVTAGLVSSPFGIRKGVMHDGIDIVAGAGTAVHAADDGTVVFAGRLRGYGNAVILQHSDGYVTVYGHNQRNLVRFGAQVARGQVIAELGATGRATGPNLHFEVRYRGQPQNPLAYLTPPPTTSDINFASNGGS